MKVLKLTALAAIFTLSIASLSAQQEKITYGIRGGLNYSNIIVKKAVLDVPMGQFNPALDGMKVNGKGGFNFDPMISFYVGAHVDFPIKKWFHIQAELVYVENKGDGGMFADFEVPSNLTGAFPTHGERPEELYLHYIQIPVLAKFYPVKNMPLLIGPYFGYLVSAKGKPTAETNAVAKDIKYMYKSIDFGLQAGIAYEFKFGLFVESRYVFGAMNTLKNEFAMTDIGITSANGKVNADFDVNTNNITGQNASFQFGIGYRF